MNYIEMLQKIVWNYNEFLQILLDEISDFKEFRRFDCNEKCFFIEYISDRNTYDIQEFDFDEILELLKDNNFTERLEEK